MIELDDGTTFEADEVLAAFGRRHGTSGIGLETIGIEPDGPLAVDDDLRVPGHDWLYAIGDVNGRVLLTHMGKYQGRLAADTILGRTVELRSDGAQSPRVIFTDPQVGAVGLTLEGAQAAGLDVRHVDVETSGNAGGSFVGHGAVGTSRIVVDTKRRVIVGATITGSEVAEALHAATIAVVAEDLDRRPLARGAVVPDPQRALAEAARGLRAVSSHQLAQINVARLLAPIDAPETADFVAALAPVNAGRMLRPASSGGCRRSRATRPPCRHSTIRS